MEASPPASGCARPGTEPEGGGAGLTVRELSDPGEQREAALLLARIWSVRTTEPPVPAELMRALAYTGSYVAGAFTGSLLVGAAVGFLAKDAAEPSPHLHSHVTGVSEAARGRGVGAALKQHQRAWALARGLEMVTWTFDPLIRRNAFFNLGRLGACAVAYLTDFYGEVGDAARTGHSSDRLLVRWDLRAERAMTRVARRCSGQAPAPTAAGCVLLGIGPGGRPQPGPGCGPGPVVCAVPPDVEGLRQASPELALAWRSALREALVPALASGRRIAGFTRQGWYLLTACDQEAAR